MVRLLRVSGNSLAPVYRHGDFVVVSKIPYLFGPIERGDVISFKHKTYGTLIKIVDGLSPDKRQISVVGTYPDSVDGDTLGPIDKRDVLGKVIWHISDQASA